MITSCQVLNETYTILLGKFGFSSDRARVVFEVQPKNEVVATTLELIVSALAIGNKLSISHWDALIIAAAIEGECGEVVTEDLQHHCWISEKGV